jgi:hypothetical protein
MVVNASALDRAQQQAMFFRDPLQDPVRPGTFGTLYLLRRDINDMKSAMPNKAIWPRTMAIMAGIDLVAKFYADDDVIGGVTTRFKDFVKEYITANNEIDAETLYQLRNSLLHSFGLYSSSKGGSVVYRFTVDQDSANWLIRQNSKITENWWVNLTELDKRFEKAVTDYDAHITAGTKTFPTGDKNIFDKYGSVSIG